VRTSLRTPASQLAAGLAALVLILALALILRRPAPQAPVFTDLPLTSSLLISTSGPAGGVNAGGVLPATSCIWSGFQSVGRQYSQPGGVWKNVGVIGAAPALTPDMVVTLEEVSFCNSQIAITWSVQNNMRDATAMMPLNNQNITVRDSDHNSYVIAEAQSQPAVIRVSPGQQGRGTVIIDQPASLTAQAITISLKSQPFGEALWLVPVVNR